MGTMLPDTAKAGACDLADMLRDTALDFMRQHPGFTMRDSLNAARILESFCLYTLERAGEREPGERYVGIGQGQRRKA